MSYRRAWGLVRMMNSAFTEALVHSESGGAGGGKAELSELGRRVLELYRTAESRASRAAEQQVAGIRSAMRNPE